MPSSALPRGRGPRADCVGGEASWSRPAGVPGFALETVTQHAEVPGPGWECHIYNLRRAGRRPGAPRCGHRPASRTPMPPGGGRPPPRGRLLPQTILGSAPAPPSARGEGVGGRRTQVNRRGRPEPSARARASLGARGVGRRVCTEPGPEGEGGGRAELLSGHPGSPAPSHRRLPAPPSPAPTPGAREPAPRPGGGRAHLGQAAPVLGVLPAQHLLQLVHPGPLRASPSAAACCAARSPALPGARPAQAPAHLAATGAGAPRAPRPPPAARRRPARCYGRVLVQGVGRGWTSGNRGPPSLLHVNPRPRLPAALPAPRVPRADAECPRGGAAGTHRRARPCARSQAGGPDR